MKQKPFPPLPDPFAPIPYMKEAREILLAADANVCVCDCLECKTWSCRSCNLGNYKGYTTNELCFQNNDLVLALAERLQSAHQKGREEALQEAAELADKLESNALDICQHESIFSAIIALKSPKETKRES